MTAPERRANGLDANARGIAVLVAAVVIGFLLLVNTGSSGGDEIISSGEGGDTGPTTTVDTSDVGGDDSTTTQPDDTTTTTEGGEEGRPPGEVAVLVLNGSGQSGVAASTSTVVGEAGYNMLDPGNAAGRSETTMVYFAEGYEPEATAVAERLGKSGDAVAAMPEEAPGPGTEEANVVVVLGTDTPPAGGGGEATTTTAAD